MHDRLELGARLELGDRLVVGAIHGDRLVVVVSKLVLVGRIFCDGDDDDV